MATTFPIASRLDYMCISYFVLSDPTNEYRTSSCCSDPYKLSICSTEVNNWKLFYELAK
jgi:hypothetical protein